MGSKYEAVWRRILPDDEINAILSGLRHGDPPFEKDATGIMRCGSRSATSLNVGITIDRRGTVRGNAAHLNCLAKILREKLGPEERLRLQTSVIGDGLKVTMRFENTTPGYVSAPEERRKTVAHSTEHLSTPAQRKETIARETGQVPALAGHEQATLQDTSTGTKDSSSARCCDDLFKGFTFQDIRRADPPPRKGAYIIRISRRGASIDEIVRQCQSIASGIAWPIVEKYSMRRINRLREITDCPLIYVGRAGKSTGSKNTLRGRYHQFAHTHTIMLALWSLLYFGWELEYGWTETPNPEELEENLKQRYASRHGGRFPALVDR